MNNEIIEQFAEVNREEKGCVYFLDNQAEIPPVLLSIFRAVEAKRVVVGGLPPAIQTLVETACQEGNIQFLKANSPAKSPIHAIAGAEVGVTCASFAVASTGTVAHVTTQEVDRLTTALCWAHVCILRANDIVPTLEDVPGLLRGIFARHQQDCTVTFATGPSRSADIEFTLQLGVHGPQQTHTLILMENSETAKGEACENPA